MRKLLSSLSIVLLWATIALAQERTVTGTVTAREDGLSLPGVSVKVKGASAGTQTGANGRYSINVPNNTAVLVFSYIGFATQEINVGARNAIDVALTADATQLGEVVVTALGITRQTRALGYSISQVDGAELTQSGEANVIQGLAAKAAGVQVTSSAGTPGASSKITLRGASTFTGNTQPLIVVDGVPIDNSTIQSSPRDYPFNENLTGVNNSNRAVDLNPQDIESVTILKGPAAAALYGARAGNGAIVYTTKRGKQAKGIGITLSLKTELSNVSQLPDQQNVYAQGNAAAYVTADPGPDNIYNTDDDVSGGASNSWGPKIASTPGLQYYDNLENFFKTGVSNDANLSLSGGNEKSSFRLAVGNLDQKGMIPNTSFKRTSVRLTTDTYLKDFLKVGGTANYVKSGGVKSQNGSNLGGIMLGLLRAPSSFDLTNYQFSNGFQRTYFALYDNPYYTAYENPFTDDVKRVNGNVYLSYIGKPWLNATYRVGIDSYSDRRRQIYAISSFANDPGDQTGQVNYNNLTNSDFYSDLIFTGGTKVTTDVNFNYTAGYNVTTSNYTDNFSRGVSLTIPNFYDLTNAANLYSSSYQEKKYTSALFGQLDFDYSNMLYLSLTGRNEWSSTFGDSQNNFFYPSASLSWVFSEVAKIPGLTFGKLRYAYSQAGISPSPYNTRTYFSLPTFTDGMTNGLTFPYGGMSGFGYSNTLGNSGLKSETVFGNEVGLDAKFLKNRLSLNLTLYKQKTKDILLLRPLAGSSGFEAEYTNSGELENKGVELELKGDLIKFSDFNWSLGINWSTNKSKVLKLAEGVEELNLESAFSDYGSYAIVGQPLGSFYGTKWQRSTDGQLVIGANGIPLKEVETGNIGNPNPDWLAGIRNTFKYKGIQLSVLFDIRHGGDILNGTYARLTRLGRTAITVDRERTYVVPGLKADGTVNTTPVSALNYFSRYLGDNGGAAEQFIETVNWFRVRELSLSYRLAPVSLTKYLNYIDLSITGRNLFLDTNYKGVDPETSLTGAGSNINGFDYFNNPGSKSFLFGINVGF